MSRTHLSILFDDDYVVAVDKPSGWDVHKNVHNGTRVIVMDVLASVFGRRVFPVHRLDGGTSGVLIFAKSKDAQRYLNREFEKRCVRKSYVALVRGHLRDSLCSDALEVDGRILTAETNFRCLEMIELPWPNKRFASSRYSLVEAVPKTGRFHQIRRHLNHLGWPIIGDSMHGDGLHNRLWRERIGVNRLMLHASTLTFEHPVSGQVSISAALPEIFQTVAQIKGWQRAVETC